MVSQNFDPPSFLDLLEGDPEGERLLFQTRLADLNVSPVQSRQLQGLFQPFFNQFLGQIGQQISRGQTPQTFRQALAEFDPRRELLRLPSAGRTFGPTIFR